VAGTFGRGIYILDDYSALRDVNAETLAAEAWLFPLRPAPPGASDSRGRRSQPQGEVVSPGRYTATLGRLTGEAVTVLGEPQTVLVVPLQR
jgi:hypothetical protein